MRVHQEFVRPSIRRFTILSCAALSLIAGIALADTPPITDDFELGDSIAPPVDGTGDIVGVSSVPGPDWKELFTAAGRLRDEVGADGNPPANGQPDFIDLYQGQFALFLGDDISAGSATDATVRFGANRLDTGPVASRDDLGNAYVYATRDALNRVLLYAGVERIELGETNIEIELNQETIRLGHGWPGVSGWELVGDKTEKDLQLSLQYAADGLLTGVVVESWEDADLDGNFEWVVKETLDGEGCNAANAAAVPARDANTLCVFRNGSSISGGDWQSFNASGAAVPNIDRDCFTEIGLNVGHLLNIDDGNYSYTTIQLRSPTDMALGYFGEGN